MSGQRSAFMKHIFESAFWIWGWFFSSSKYYIMIMETADDLALSKVYWQMT